MGTFSDAEKNKMLDAGTEPLYVQLHTGDPGAAGTSNVATETTRQSVPFATAASGGSKSNTSQAQWTSYPAAETITWVSFWDAASGGTFCGKDDLPASKSPGVGDILTLASGSLSLAL